MTSTALSDYVVAIRVDELSEQLRRQGYSVDASGDGVFDLVAEREGRRYAYHVIARGNPSSRPLGIELLQRKAAELRYDGFRLVVASPPEPTLIDIPDLESKLLAVLRPLASSTFAQLGAEAAIEEVSDVRVRLVDLGSEPWRIGARGTVLVEFTPRGGPDRERLSWGFPFSVEVAVDRNLQPLSVRGFEPDVADYFSETAGPPEAP